MIPILDIVTAACGAFAGACGKKKPTTAKEIEQQRVLQRNERAMWFFIVFCLIFSAVLLVLLAFD